MKGCSGSNTESSVECDEESVEGIIESSSEGLSEGSFLNIIIDVWMDGNCEVYTIDGIAGEIAVGSSVGAIDGSDNGTIDESDDGMHAGASDDLPEETIDNEYISGIKVFIARDSSRGTILVSSS